ncbi:MAG: hypothetical protein K5756_09360, partial [Clostridiales bacterium]|nr:hypothetical protein [Clostridiales bacterium]
EETTEGLFPHTVATDRKQYTAVEIPDVPNDPYCRVIREYYQLVLDESSDAQDDLNYFKYMLYDIDGDGTKELLLSGIKARENPEENKNIILKHIFTIKDGSAYEVKLPTDQFSEEDRPDLTKITNFTVYTNGLIAVSMKRNLYYLRYKQGTLTYVKDLVYKASETDNSYEYHYKYYGPDENGKRQFIEEISEADAINLRQNLQQGSGWIEYVWLPLESYGRVKQARDYYYLIVKDYYDRFLNSYYKFHKDESTDKKALEDNMNGNFYAFYDIDGNGTEELLIARTEYLWGSGYFSTRDPYLPVERGVVFYEIYSFDGESVQKVKCIPSYRWDHFFYNLGGRDVLTNGLIRYYGGSPEYVSYIYFKYSDGGIEFIKELLCGEEKTQLVTETDDKGNNIYKDITKSEFDRIKAETEDGAKMVDIDWQTLKSFGDKNS